jgi:hypothetical protein
MAAVRTERSKSRAVMVSEHFPLLPVAGTQSASVRLGLVARCCSSFTRGPSNHQKEVQQWLTGLMPLAPREVGFIRKRLCMLRVAVSL